MLHFSFTGDVLYCMCILNRHAHEKENLLIVAVITLVAGTVALASTDMRQAACMPLINLTPQRSSYGKISM